MQWKGKRASTNVEDARGRRRAVNTAGAGVLLNMVGRRFGSKYHRHPGICAANITVIPEFAQQLSPSSRIFA